MVPAGRDGGGSAAAAVRLPQRRWLAGAARCVSRAWMYVCMYVCVYVALLRRRAADPRDCRGSRACAPSDPVRACRTPTTVVAVLRRGGGSGVSLRPPARRRRLLVATDACRPDVQSAITGTHSAGPGPHTHTCGGGGGHSSQPSGGGPDSAEGCGGGGDINFISRL